MSLVQKLSKLLAQQGEMPFVAFMQEALYAPNEGYYSSGLLKLGRAGDFITAPELTPLFGQSLAQQCQQVLSELEDPVLFEYGAGSGRLCVDLLRHLQQLDCLPKQYLILEVSANLRHRQQELIEKAIPNLASKIFWLDSLPKEPLNGVILANEVLDAMPVHRFLSSEQGLLESFICLDDQGQLAEVFKPCTDQRLFNYVQNHLQLNAPYLSEVNLFVEDWILNNYNALDRGIMLLIDYGYPRHEYYHPDRNQGTLMCHYRHQVHTNPLVHVGEQDLTAHVDFTQVAEAGQRAGFHIAGYTHQASFLLGNGLLSLLSALEPGRGQLEASQAVKQLTHPSEMGELFKVMALAKGMDLDLNGFRLFDKRASL